MNIFQRFKMTAPEGKIARTIWTKIQNALNPTHLEVINESSRHVGHDAVKNVESKETHFRLVVVAEEFKDMVPNN